jgi:hypothetical protein
LTEGNEENKDCFSACAIWMDASLPWFSSAQKISNFPRNSRPNLAQYISERPELTSYGKKPKKAKTTKAIP